MTKADIVAEELTEARRKFEEARNVSAALRGEILAHWEKVRELGEAGRQAQDSAASLSRQAEAEADPVRAAQVRQEAEAAAQTAADLEARRDEEIAAADEASARLKELERVENEAAAAFQEAQRRSGGSPMKERWKLVETATDRVLASIGSLAIGLIAVLIGFFAIQLFYATQLHLRISEMQLNGVPINIWRTQDIRNSIARWSIRLDEQQQDLIKARNKYDNALRASEARERGRREAEQEVLGDVNEGLVMLQLPSDKSTPLTVVRQESPPGPELEQGAPQDSQDNPVDAPDRLSNADLGYILFATRFSETASANTPQWQKRRATIEDHYEAFNLARRDAENAKKAVLEAKLELDNADKTRKGTEAEAERLFGASLTDVDAGLVERVRNVISELDTSAVFDDTTLDDHFQLADWLPRFVLWPTDNLVLSLVVIMGILGSCLHLMAERFGLARPVPGEAPADSRTGFDQALLRLFYGGVTALVVYLVAKASVPIITDTSRTGGQSPLNPYFISFVGIMSGLVSERAMRSLRNMGEGIFSTGGLVDTTPRYATPMLTNAVTSEPDAVLKLAGYLNLRPGDATDAVNGKRALTPNEQAVIAAFARANPREAFSDLKPEAPEGAGG